MPISENTHGWKVVPEELTEEMRDALMYVRMELGSTLRDNADDIYSALLSAAPPPTPLAAVQEPVVVKALEWQQHDDRDYESALDIFKGLYIANEEGWRHASFGLWHEESSLADAKAAAQADYEQRILSALSPSQIYPALKTIVWPIETEDQVEELARECEWNNRRFMTAADYTIWCERMRRFARLASCDINQAVAAERERCALIAEGRSKFFNYQKALDDHDDMAYGANTTRTEVALAIREGRPLSTSQSDPSPEIATLGAEIERLREALEWYGENARLCRLIHNEGDKGRYALAADGGNRARAAIAPDQVEAK